MVQILEPVQAHYENREMPFGKIYAWHPASVALECECGEKVTLSATSSTQPPAVGAAPTWAPSSTTSESAKAVCRTISPTPGSMMLKSGHNNTSMMKPPILKAPAGATTILQQPPTRSKQKEKDSHASRTNRQRDGGRDPLEASGGPRQANRTAARRGAGGRP